MIRLTKTTRARPENIVPMINVAFLLLVFFLMSASLSLPDQIDIVPPDASVSENANDGVTILSVTRDGTVWRMGEELGSFESINSPLPSTLELRIDRDLEAERLAVLLSKLDFLGVSDVKLRVRSN